MKTIQKSGEDYLEVIYNLSLECENVRSTDISNALKVTKPSTHKALISLAEQGYIQKQPYGTVMLTERGSVIAKSILKKHKAIRTLLIDILGVSQANAEIDACKIEHCIGEETTKKLYDFLSKAAL